jgi:UDP-glucose 4-epimerase
MTTFMRKILVTGSSGMIGTHLSVRLRELGYEVVGADRRPNRWRPELDAATVDVDLRDLGAVMERLPGDADLVIHLAANARVHNLVIDPTLAHDNITTAFNMLEYCRRRGVKRFMFASSREVYGNSDQVVHREDDTKLIHCESAYSASKMTGEAMCWAYRRCYGIDAIVFRFSNVYGRYDVSDRVIPLFIRRAAMGEDLVVFGEHKLLDFTYIDDTVAGIVGAIWRFDTAKNETFNLACGSGFSIMDLAHNLKRMIGSSSKVAVLENRTGEVVKYVADISKARALLGFNPSTPIDQGLERTVEWYKDFSKGDLASLEREETVHKLVARP